MLVSEGTTCRRAWNRSSRFKIGLGVKDRSLSALAVFYLRCTYLIIAPVFTFRRLHNFHEHTSARTFLPYFHCLVLQISTFSTTHHSHPGRSCSRTVYRVNKMPCWNNLGKYFCLSPQLGLCEPAKTQIRKGIGNARKYTCIVSRECAQGQCSKFLTLGVVWVVKLIIQYSITHYLTTVTKDSRFRASIYAMVGAI